MTWRFRSRDGWFSSSDPKAVAEWDAIGDRMATDVAGWTAVLRGMGVKLAHPDDGWVTSTTKRPSPEPRGDGYLTLSWYAQFNDSPREGDLIALGYGYGKHWAGDYNYRLVRVTQVEERIGPVSGGRIVKYHFEDTGRTVPDSR